jgi:hypothetical protein
MNRTKEKLAVYAVQKALGIKKYDGKFKYVKKGSREISFEWDGAGVDKNGSIVLVEVELQNPTDWHIQCHLSRIAIMISCGEKVKKLVWVTYPSKYQKLRSIVDTWMNYFSHVCNVEFPQIEYRTTDGKALPSV